MVLKNLMYIKCQLHAMFCTSLTSSAVFPPIDRLCPVCKTIVEDERHFLLSCQLYSDLRTRFLADMLNLPLTALLSCERKMGSRMLSKFIFHAINRRKKFIDD